MTVADGPNDGTSVTFWAYFVTDGPELGTSATPGPTIREEEGDQAG